MIYLQLRVSENHQNLVFKSNTATGDNETAVGVKKIKRSVKAEKQTLKVATVLQHDKNVYFCVKIRWNLMKTCWIVASLLKPHSLLCDWSAAASEENFLICDWSGQRSVTVFLLFSDKMFFLKTFPLCEPAALQLLRMFSTYTLPTLTLFTKVTSCVYYSYLLFNKLICVMNRRCYVACICVDATFRAVYNCHCDRLWCIYRWRSWCCIWLCGVFIIVSCFLFVGLYIQHNLKPS